MILSLEEDEEEFDLQDVTQNVNTVDDEYLNGTLRGANRLMLRQPETVSVCSCTCYPTSGVLGGALGSNAGASRPKWWWHKFISRWSNSRVKEDGHYFNAETGSISNVKRNATKRNSL